MSNSRETLSKIIFIMKFEIESLSVQKVGHWFNTLPNDKILDWSKLKAFADDKCE